MPRDFTPAERLDILRSADKLRTWSSLEDERLCILCERILNGWQIEILRDQRGRYLLKCPTPDCASFVAHRRDIGDASTVYATGACSELRTGGFKKNPPVVTVPRW